MDLVLAWWAAYNAGDLDAVMDFYAPDVEAFPDPGFPESRPLHGREEFKRWVEEIGSAWTGARRVVHEIRAIEPERVLERGDWGGVGVGSSIETYANYSAIYTIRDGQICKAEYFADHDKALEAVGLTG